MKKFLLVLIISTASWHAFAQTGSVKGRVTDKANGESLIGANILIKGSDTGTITDMSGNFKLPGIETGDKTLVISFVGYQEKEVPLTIRAGETADVGTIPITEQVVGMNEVLIMADVVTERETPVAVSTLKGIQIESRISNQEFPEVLRSTPSIYVTKQGGGFGDARINIRGFDQRNTAVMINGVPVNDMENGWVYWSNWAGLSDVTNTLQVQRGLGASKLAISSVGGSINIVTDAAKMKKGGSASTTFGNDGYQKYGLVLSTGLSESGWAVTINGSHTRGDGYADGTGFSSWAYFASIAKQINNSHSLSLTVLGAPQWHHQRGYGSFDGVTYEALQDRGLKYNPQWGNLRGDEFSWRKNFYHKPKAFLKHYWTVSEHTDITTSVYGSLGRGGGTGDLGRINGAFRTSGQFKSTAEGLVRWDDIVEWNNGQDVEDFGAPQVPWSGPGVETADPSYNGPFAGENVAESYRNGFIRRSSVNNHNWYGIISSLTHELSEQLTLVAGIDARYYKGEHYRRLEDLLGLDAYFDDNDINQPEKYVTGQGDDDAKIDYYNDGLVKWLGAFGQVEYAIDRISLFTSFSLSSQGFKRIDYFNYLDSDTEQESGWENFLGGTLKAGVNYNLSEEHNVFVNGGYFSRQPDFDNIFVNFINEVNEEAENQKVYAVEAGYGFRSGMLRANLNLYHTEWSNRQLTKGITVNGTEGIANFTGIGQIHQGIEADVVASPAPRLTLTGMASFGNWRYTKNFQAAIFNDERKKIGDATLFTDGVKIPDAAQTTFNFNAAYGFTKGFKANVNYYRASRVFADFAISDETFATIGGEAWELPGYDLVDAGISYSFDLGDTRLTWRLNVNNIFDEEYISESETNRLAVSGEPVIPGTNASTSNIVYYGFGRTWTTGIKVRF